MELTSFLSLLAQALLIIALPIVIAAAIQVIRAQAQRIDQDRLEMVKTIARTAVRVAEQTGLVEGLTGPEKRDRAIQVAQDFLRQRGISLNLSQLVSMIESEVVAQFNNPTAPVDTPETRQALIEKAIEAAVLAAEQSGLKGAIQNLSSEKKAFAMQMAARYLEELNVTVSEELMSGLIEAQVLRFTLAARGQLPSQTGAVRR